MEVTGENGQVRPPPHKQESMVQEDSKVEALGEIDVPLQYYNRILSGIEPIDHMFGDSTNDSPGLILGSTVLFTGDPGAGKSTTALQLADAFQRKGYTTLYNSGEEAKPILKMRGERIGLSMRFGASTITSCDELLEEVKKRKVKFLFVDSLQTLQLGAWGRIANLKATSAKLQNFAHTNGVNMFIIGQCTKGGKFAGPNEIKHSLDVHAHLSIDPTTGNRTMQVEKNRFGDAYVPHELALSAHGVDFKVNQSATPEAPTSSGPAKRGTEHQRQVVAFIRKKLLEGEKISGYCFDRFNIDCSGGFWRGMLAKAVSSLEQEGHALAQERINGRLHEFVVKAQ